METPNSRIDSQRANRFDSGVSKGRTSGLRKGPVVAPTSESNIRRAVRVDQLKQYPPTLPGWKHNLDVICILLTAPLWLPLMVFVVLLIKVVSPGPVFFKQERVGYRGRSFMILKFRSMHVNACTKKHEYHFRDLIQSDRPMVKLDGTDKRLIPFGRILRATGLDELPQLINVLRGEMSLVGPRPCTPHEFDHYEEWQKERINALPGLTGNWQVNGKNKTTFIEMIEMDIYYARNLTLRWDVAIILKTIPAIIGQVMQSRAARQELENVASQRNALVE